MSGNYDYPIPPASRRTARGSRASDRLLRHHGRLQHLQDLLNSERNRNTSARALETFNQEIGEYRSGRTRDRSIVEQSRAFEEQQLQAERLFTADRIHGVSSGLPPPRMIRVFGGAGVNTNPSDPSRSVSRGSRRAVRGDDRPSRNRRNRDSNLPSILDQPIPRLESSIIMPQDPDNDSQADNRWRAKRRKLDSDDNREGLQSFRYGQYGQVVPGTLKMELASCDGGTYEQEGESSWPENILRNDPSVYCTKSDRCNLILKHRGEAPFCLKKLVIKAPKSGYDAPIQAGMVFISMASDELMSTAQYQIECARHRRHQSHQHNNLSSQEYFPSFRTPLQSLDRALAGSDSHSESETDAGDLIGPSPNNIAEPANEFRVTMEYDERSDRGDHEGIGEFELPSITDLERLEEDRVSSDSDDSISEDDDNDTSESNSFNARRQDLRRRIRNMRRQYAMEQEAASRRHSVANTSQALPTNTSARQRTGMGPRSANPGLMKPLAQFYIKQHKSSVSLKFDPPPSGRYILIKLWNPHHGGNIDIQSIIAHGFAGPRFFPASGHR